jgi:fatty-acyl-CoA synthase
MEASGANSAALSYSSGTGTVPLLGETIGENLRRTAERYADREALVDVAAGRRWTYREFDAAVDEVARGLLARGLAKGDRVGIWAPNCAEWILTQYATARIGAILVNINPSYRTHELDYVVRQSGLSLLISAESFKTSDYRAMIAETGFGQTLFIGGPDWDQLLRIGRAVDPASCATERPNSPSTTRSTSSTPRGPPDSRRARRSPTTTC